MGKYWSSFFFFASLWTELQVRSIHCQKKNKSNIWRYFKFPDSIAHVYIKQNTCATKTNTLILFCHVAEVLAQFLVRQVQGKYLYLMPKCPLLNIFSRTQNSKISSGNQ